jgi:Family of unknown function (DUF5716)
LALEMPARPGLATRQGGTLQPLDSLAAFSAGDILDEGAAIRALARRLVARLEESGWMHFQYRAGVGEIMSFHAYAARILQSLLAVARDEQPVFQGLVHSIATLLESTAFAQRPGVSLSEARRHTLELSRELKILERNIHLFIQRVLDDASTAAEVLEEGFDRYRDSDIWDERPCALR